MKNNIFGGYFIAGGILMQTVVIYGAMAIASDKNLDFLSEFHLVAIIMGFFLAFVIYNINVYLKEYPNKN